MKNWEPHEKLEKTLQSSCGEYRITNFREERGGDKYCLWKKRSAVFLSENTGEMADSWCELLTIGTAKHCKEFIDDNR